MSKFAPTGHFSVRDRRHIAIVFAWYKVFRMACSQKWNYRSSLFLLE